ncbi:uncharacterized protein LOC123471354 [Daphnia magna]|uniref:uncharacterized protein LOC123471354 n=1 Tax=Daphnia magna TaxID=35525 RepID=UPI001E1BC8FE|nr:uncharacterized protein LOC123471354 [Daphnia magna]
MFPNKKTTERCLIDEFRSFFVSIGGVPIKIRSDNSLFPAVELQDFLRDWNVGWGSSSPHYPQSNGRAEAGINAIKALVARSRTGGAFDQNKMAKALLLYRNAPRIGLQSPPQLIFNRPIRDGLPAHRRSFASEWQKEAREIEQRQHKILEKSTTHYNRDAKDLPELSVGDHVLIQNPDSKRWVTPGVVVETGPNWDYMVKTPFGRIFLRNRRMLRKKTVVMPGTIPPAENAPTAAVEPIQPAPATERAAPITTAKPEKRTDGQQGQKVEVGCGRERGRIPPTRQSTRISLPSNRYLA